MTLYTERPVHQCYICRGQGHTASCCYYANNRPSETQTSVVRRRGARSARQVDQQWRTRPIPVPDICAVRSGAATKDQSGIRGPDIDNVPKARWEAERQKEALALEVAEKQVEDLRRRRAQPQDPKTTPRKNRSAAVIEVSQPRQNQASWHEVEERGMK